ncbi:putative capsid protein [Bovine faeces associated smacovirus 4]|uniref:Putative capsid protein n=1 Tax=Bovine faeces associated smacovirus 4 TaxID=1843752 RepID=A0A160HWI8_9VIRU|nr:putative capsid protein [Bovine faeces associated smacovirus 4]ANC51544.1 putative capsid protein [Bovine faeces associated smacovirus 4]
MVTVTVSETYDLSTKVNKMSLIGIHTPGKSLIQKSYPGLLMNSKYISIDKVDVTLAAVSTLPISPDQVGLDVDNIAPQDMMNPILYKAVSNDSMSNIEARLHGLGFGSGTQVSGSMVDAINDNVTGISDEFNVYYSLLSNRDGFRIAHPQQGLSMRGLVPLVFDKYYNVGAFMTNSQEVTDVGDTGADETPSGDLYPTLQYSAGSLSVVNRPVQAMRGRPHRMPRFPTLYVTAASSGSSQSTNQRVANGIADGQPLNCEVLMPDILPVYLGMIIMPPAKRTVMFYRMVVRATLTFSEVRPMSEITSFAGLNSGYGSEVYHTDYALQSKQMESTTDLVDVQNANIEKIMEGR